MPIAIAKYIIVRYNYNETLGVLSKEKIPN